MRALRALGVSSHPTPHTRPRAMGSLNSLFQVALHLPSCQDHASMRALRALGVSSPNPRPRDPEGRLVVPPPARAAVTPKPYSLNLLPKFRCLRGCRYTSTLNPKP